jgi:hypothetical protein
MPRRKLYKISAKDTTIYDVILFIDLIINFWYY